MSAYHSVTDDAKLLAALVEDSGRAPAEFRPTPYWQGYAVRIVDELARAGINDFRRNQTILKGFGAGGTPRPALPEATWKRAIWAALAGAPGFARIAGEYERLLATVGQQQRQAEVRFARQILPRIAQAFPNLAVPAGLANGNPDDTFEWQGQTVTADWVRYLARAADFYARVSPAEVRAILEIGPGFGLSTLAHVALNRHLRTIVNIDIVPVIYVSTRFLSSNGALRVIDYNAVRDASSIAIEPSDTLTVWSLPAWMLPRVQGAVDYAFNAYSFQEMEEDVCRLYAGEIARLARSGVQLYSAVAGHRPGAGGQRKPVTMEFLRQCFAKDFPRAEPLGGFWIDAYEAGPGEAFLLRRG